MTLPITSPFHMCVHWNRKTTVWIWVKESYDGSQQAGVMDPVGSSWWDRGGESQGGCVQMALGTPGQWRKAPCSGRYLFLCENDVTGKILIHWCQIIRSDNQYIETIKIHVWVISSRVSAVWGYLSHWVGSDEWCLYRDPDKAACKHPRPWTSDSGGQF